MVELAKTLKFVEHGAATGPACNDMINLGFGLVALRPLADRITGQHQSPQSLQAPGGRHGRSRGNHKMIKGAA